MSEPKIRNVARDGGPVAPDPSATVAARPDFSSTPRWVWAWFLLLIVLVFLYLARTILSPFIIAGVLAYIFSMVIDRVQARLGWPAY